MTNLQPWLHTSVGFSGNCHTEFANFDICQPEGPDVAAYLELMNGHLRLKPTVFS